MEHNDSWLQFRIFNWSWSYKMATEIILQLAAKYHTFTSLHLQSCSGLLDEEFCQIVKGVRVTAD